MLSRKPNRGCMLCICAVMALGSTAPVLAGGAQPANPQPELFSGYSVAFIPFAIQTERKQTTEKLIPALTTLFQDLGFTTVAGLPVMAAVKTACGETVAAAGTQGFPTLPDDAMTKVGQVLGVRYVICGNMKVESARLWYGTPKGKAFLDTKIVDVRAGKAVYATKTAANSHANVTGQVVTAVIIGPIFGPIFGLFQSEAKQEAKALQNVIIKAYDPFFVQLRDAATGQPAPAQ